MNPYDIDYSKFKPSKEITDPRDIFKLKLLAYFKKMTEDLSTQEIIEKVGLDKSDISRLRVSDYRRFTIDRLINILGRLGCEFDLKLKPKKVS
jgi:predicted XRE-type DNA-binding protein